jgi:hypothetical protein
MEYKNPDISSTHTDLRRQSYLAARYLNPQCIPLKVQHYYPGYNIRDLFYTTQQIIKDTEPRQPSGDRHRTFGTYAIEWWEGDAPKLENLLYNNKIPTWITISNTVFPNHNEVVDPYHVQLHPSSYSNYYKNYEQQYKINVLPDQGFNCFLNRLDVIRQSWFYQLNRHNLLDHGYVSFNMDITRVKEEFKNLTVSQVFQAQFERYHSSVFAEEHKIAQSLVPYRNFDQSKDLDDVVMQSKFSIIVETYFDDNNAITFTEKTIRALRLPRPWVLFGPKNSVKQLRTWGFDVLDDLVDHNSYDQFESHIERETVMLDMAKTLLQFDTQQHWHRLKKASDHNLKLLEDWALDLGEYYLLANYEAIVKAHRLGYVYPPPGIPTPNRVWANPLSEKVNG